MKHDIFRTIGIGVISIVGITSIAAAIVGISTVGVSKMVTSAAIITVGCCIIAITDFYKSVK